jgi:O-antigen ligase
MISNAAGRPPGVAAVGRRLAAAPGGAPVLLAGALLLTAVLELVVLRRSSVAPAAAAALALVAFVVVSLMLDVVPVRAQPFAFAAFGLLLTPALVRVVLDGGRELKLPLELAGLVLALVVLTPRPAAAFAAWLLLAPYFQLAARHVEIGYWANNVLYLAPPVLFALWTLTPARTHARRLRPRVVDSLPLGYLALAGVSLAFSSWAKETGYRSAVDQLYQNVGIGVVCYYFCVFGPARGRLGERFLAALLGSGAVVAVLAIIERATGWTPWGHSASEAGRVAATLSSAGVLGAYLGAAIAAAVAVLLWHGPPALRRLSWIALPLAVPALGFTLTRGPILATLVVVVAMIVFRRSAVRLAVAGIAVLLAVVAIGSWSTISSSSLYRGRVAESSNVQSRLLIDRWSIKLFERKPVLGHGYGSFDAIKNSAQLSPGNLPLAAGKDYTSHNTFLTILVELGAIGLALLLLPWLLVSSAALRGVIRGTAARPWLPIACVGVLGAYALTALTTDMRFFSIVPALAWIAVGVLRGETLGEDSAAADTPGQA